MLLARPLTVWLAGCCFDTANAAPELFDDGLFCTQDGHGFSFAFCYIMRAVS
jgi:hypothetical protein